jgi:hypothetical protein
MNKNNIMDSDPDSAKSLDPDPKINESESATEELY